MSTGISLRLAPFIDGLPDRDLRRIFRSNPQGAASLVSDLETMLRNRAGDMNHTRALLARLAPMTRVAAPKQPGKRTRPRGAARKTSHRR